MKANAYGHGAVDCGGAALDAGARPCASRRSARRSCCVASCRRRASSSSGRRRTARSPQARDAGLELVVSSDRHPGGRRRAREARHGHGPLGRVGAAGADAGRRRRDDAPRDCRQRPGLRPRADRAVSRGDRLRSRTSRATSRTAPRRSRLPESRFDAARCGIALYGLSPFGADPAERRPRAGARLDDRDRADEAAAAPASRPATAGRFVAERDTWIGIVPVGYADGFRRDLTGTEVRVGGETLHGRRHGLDGRHRRRARPRTAARDAGDDRRSRRAARGARARRRDDHLRARLRHRVLAASCARVVRGSTA